MSILNNALNAFVEEKLLNLHTSMPCKVLSFDGKEATVQPLFLKTTQDEQAKYPPIEGVPVLKQRFKYTYDDTTIHGDVTKTVTLMHEAVYEAGDIVLVVFSERALDNVLSGSIADPQFNRRHSLSDAIIVGLIQ